MPDENKNGQNGAEGATGGNNGAGEGQNGAQNGSGSQEKTFTQADVDRIVTERLERDRKAREKEQEEARKEAERQAELEKMDATQRVEAEKADALAKAEQAQADAAHADRKLDLVIEALRQGVDPNVVDRDFLALVGAFSSTDESPEESVKKLLTKFPALTGGTGRSTSSDAGGDDKGSTIPSFDDYTKMDPAAKTKFWQEHPETARQYHEKLANPNELKGAALWNL